MLPAYKKKKLKGLLSIYSRNFSQCILFWGYISKYILLILLNPGVNKAAEMAEGSNSARMHYGYMRSTGTYREVVNLHFAEK